MSSLYLAGHTGMVGRALARKGLDYLSAERNELDLTSQADVESFFSSNSIETVILAAARVGGIGDNLAHPADFGLENGLITLNIIKAALAAGVQDLLFLGSSCMYPANVPQPMSEEALLTAVPEPTNEMYALAKIYGVKLCAAVRKQYGLRYRSLIPCNLYGPYDRFGSSGAHVIPALIDRFHQAKEEGQASVIVWGDGSPLREFLHVDDLADAILWSLDNEWEEDYLNCGSGEEVSIRLVAKEIASLVGYQGEISFDCSRPNGIARKCLDSRKIADYGWRPRYSFHEGVAATYEWYTTQHAVNRS